jgi:hypothetical protein
VAIPIALTEIASAGEASLAMTGGNVSFGVKQRIQPFRYDQGDKVNNLFNDYIKQLYNVAIIKIGLHYFAC